MKEGEPGMEKIDLKVTLKDLYTASSKEPKIVTVPQLNYLMVDGTGDPNTAPAYAAAIEALYSVAYTAKFALKRSGAGDYAVMPLEGLWWVEDMREFSILAKDEWLWTAMILQPEAVTEEVYLAAKAGAQKKKALPALPGLRLAGMSDGLSAQIMHLGPFAAEGPTIEKLHQFIREQGYTMNGKHREIYLSDFRRTAPEKLRTIIRQPIRPADQ